MYVFFFLITKRFLLKFFLFFFKDVDDAEVMDILTKIKSRVEELDEVFIF